jgi:toxin-antitoxin system PIN domain toxin
MTFLLDVNVLIALLDARHLQHDIVHEWFQREGQARWATCPITENGLVRILSHPKYPNTMNAPAAVLDVLSAMRAAPGHEFWPDEISLTDGSQIHRANLLNSGQVTDTYLLALAVRKHGQLATLDKRLASLAVRNATQSLRIVGP